MGDVVVVSEDGTELSVRVTGSGSPVVLVHGTTGSKESWAFVEPALAADHTVWSYDRRGRGASGDGPSYALAHEVADVAAVVDAAGGRAHLVGHSFGAVCALEAAAAGAGLASLTVYEPPLHTERRADAVDRAVRHLDAGEIEKALLVFLPEVAGLSDEEVALIRSIPDVWSRFVEAAPTARREAEALAPLGWTPARYAGISVPTLLMSGGATESPVYLTHEELADAVPHAQHRVLDGQRHIAFATDPGGFVAAVRSLTANV